MQAGCSNNYNAVDQFHKELESMSIQQLIETAALDLNEIGESKGSSGINDYNDLVHASQINHDIQAILNGSTCTLS